MGVRDIDIASKKGMAPKDVTNADVGAMLMSPKDEPQHHLHPRAIAAAPIPPMDPPPPPRCMLPPSGTEATWEGS
jgi:hypothetical protein